MFDRAHFEIVHGTETYSQRGVAFDAHLVAVHRKGEKWSDINWGSEYADIFTDLCDALDFRDELQDRHALDIAAYVSTDEHDAPERLVNHGIMLSDRGKFTHSPTCEGCKYDHFGYRI
jgi:hypothetical protein